jgi:hypothetical protein
MVSGEASGAAGRHGDGDSAREGPAPSVCYLWLVAPAFLDRERGGWDRRDRGMRCERERAETGMEEGVPVGWLLTGVMHIGGGAVCAWVFRWSSSPSTWSSSGLHRRRRASSHGRGRDRRWGRHGLLMAQWCRGGRGDMTLIAGGGRHDRNWPRSRKQSPTAARVPWRGRRAGLGKGKRKRGEKLRRGGCPTLPMDKERAAGDAVCSVPGGEAPIATLVRHHPSPQTKWDMKCRFCP